MRLLCAGCCRRRVAADGVVYLGLAGCLRRRQLRVWWLYNLAAAAADSGRDINDIIIKFALILTLLLHAQNCFARELTSSLARRNCEPLSLASPLLTVVVDSIRRRNAAAQSALLQAPVLLIKIKVSRKITSLSDSTRFGVGGS